MIKLSITNIGDLLLKEKITRMADGTAGRVYLTVPDYQRPYKWSARNAIQLLDDITEARNNNKEVYRVGTLILHEEVRSDGSVVHNIVDGQQRVITFSLLLHALYELKKEHEDDDNNKDVSIGFLDQEVFCNQFNRHNIANNYHAYYRRLNRGSTEAVEKARHLFDMNRLRDFIETQCEMIVVTTNDISEAFQFFDSQNARGKALYPHDLLKAYHLREMCNENLSRTEKIVEEWERIPQLRLAQFFGEYLYKLKEWINGNRADELSERNIHKFKGVTQRDRTPYAQFYKSAYAYASLINNSPMPFVSGSRAVNAFQINAPIIAGLPFFEYTQHYFLLLRDIQDNSKYEGFYIQDNPIVKTLDAYFKYGTGNKLTRQLFDSALLLYVDRFCPETFPTKEDIDLFEEFVVQAFVWAYSLRAQYASLGWLSAQNYILGQGGRLIRNSFNIYKCIIDADSPLSLMSELADRLSPLSTKEISHGKAKENLDKPDTPVNGIYPSYIYFFKINNYLA